MKKMETIIKTIVIFVFITICLWIISEGINKQLKKELERQKELNKKILSLFQNERDKSDTLYRIIFHIRSELSLLKLKDCPEEEFKNIPFEIIEWIDMLERISNGEDDGVYKQI